MWTLKLILKKKKKPPLALTEYVSGFLIIKHKVEINIALY